MTFSYSIDNLIDHDIFHDHIKPTDQFIIPVAASLYKLAGQQEYQVKEFKNIAKNDKSFWDGYAELIPSKFRTLDLFVHRFDTFCRTCIISDEEISVLSQKDYGILSMNRSLRGVKNLKPFFIELNRLIPIALKSAGYEIIRYEEVRGIDPHVFRKLARVIHSRYLHELKNQREDNEDNIDRPENPGDCEFDDLPDEMQFSNIDNAAHIPTKLLAIGYKIRQVKKGYKPYALHLTEEEVEVMARVEHIRWSWEKRLNGWFFGKVRDEIRRLHPSLTPYDMLSDSEKEKDRELVKLIPAFLKDINYEAYPVSPNLIKKLSYVIKPQSSIHKILEETRELNDHIRKLVSLTPPIEEMIRLRNTKIEEAISEVESSYNYAQHIQETFLPDDFYIRECFPDSFVLFKPKDIVSGDFYFFSRRDNRIIFAAVDCTGHGIPGALLSTLGYGILDQAVNEIKLTDPSHILHHLYSKIHRYLRNDAAGKGISDDMDIILCIFDTKTNLLTYSGVKNPLYCVSKGELTEYQAQNIADENCEDTGCKFTSTEIALNNSDTLYLCSDGYTDQFGGRRHKKYQKARFRKFLLGIHEYPMAEQSDLLNEEIERWKEENKEDPTDDILVIGIRI